MDSESKHEIWIMTVFTAITVPTVSGIAFAVFQMLQ
jgi:hypothetical protein